MVTEEDRAAVREMSAELNRAMAKMLDPSDYAALTNPDGLARQQLWQARDGWIVGYTTERIRGGRFAGAFAVLAYRPVGKGSRTGKPEEWQRVTFSRCATRRRARERAETLYERHNG